jgi:hypothetical protein
MEARLEDVGSGLAPVSEGWFAVNTRDAAWLANPAFGARCVFQADAPVLRDRPDLTERRFPHLAHCPAGTAHVFVGAGQGPCVLFMVGARTPGKSIVYPRSEAALRHGAGVEEETPSPQEAYGPFPHWQPGRPASPEGLPWEADWNVTTGR